MYDNELLCEKLIQISEALDRVARRFEWYTFSRRFSC